MQLPPFLIYVGLGLLTAASLEALKPDSVNANGVTGPGALISYAPDTACGGSATGKPALNFEINGVSFVAEFDSGASAALMIPATATAVKWSSFPPGPQTDLAFSNQAPGTFSSHICPVSAPGLPAIKMPIYSDPRISCNIIPTLPFEQLYRVGLGLHDVLFTQV